MSDTLSVDLIVRSARAAAVAASRQLAHQMADAHYDIDDVEQIAREALITQLRSGAFDRAAPTNADGYLFTVAKNAIVDALRTTHPASQQTQRDIAAIAHAIQQWRTTHTGQPGIRDLMKVTALSERRIRRAMSMRAVLGTVPWDESIEGYVNLSSHETQIADASAIQTALDQLTPDDRTLLQLIAKEGHTSAEIAEQRGVSRQYVARQVRTAKQRFMEAYRLACEH
jgi:RNA polymerase sigma factor (sigma-70 family)